MQVSLSLLVHPFPRRLPLCVGWVPQVRNSRYLALIEGFTSTTYAMIIASDFSIQPATIQVNIEAARNKFESLIANMSASANLCHVSEHAGMEDNDNAGALSFTTGGQA